MNDNNAKATEQLSTMTGHDTEVARLIAEALALDPECGVALQARHLFLLACNSGGTHEALTLSQVNARRHSALLRRLGDISTWLADNRHIEYRSLLRSRYDTCMKECQRLNMLDVMMATHLVSAESPYHEEEEEFRCLRFLSQKASQDLRNYGWMYKGLLERSVLFSGIAKSIVGQILPKVNSYNGVRLLPEEAISMTKDVVRPVLLEEHDLTRFGNAGGCRAYFTKACKWKAMATLVADVIGADRTLVELAFHMIDFVKDFSAAHGQMPSRDAIRKELGLASPEDDARFEEVRKVEARLHEKRPTPRNASIETLIDLLCQNDKPDVLRTLRESTEPHILELFEHGAIVLAKRRRRNKTLTLLQAVTDKHPSQVDLQKLKEYVIKLADAFKLPDAQRDQLL